jgi:oxalate---CoA ligase
LLFRLRELWERLLNSGPLAIDDDFFEKGGDSLLAVEMLCEVERLTGQVVPSSILFEATTIRQLAQQLSQGENLQPKSLIHMSANGSQAPLIFFHGDINGPGYYVTRLARLMGPDQPLIVIAPHGSGSERIPRSIEAMAADRLPLIINAQPQGPYRLAGYCIGGLVAFEAARMLVSAGKKVEMVIIIDSPTVNARRSVQTLLSILARARPIGDPHVERAMAWIWSHIASFDNLSLPQRWSRIRAAARRVVTGRVRTTFRADGPDGSYAIRKVNERDRNLKYASVMSNYFPKPLVVQVIYFSAKYNARAWLQISSDIEVIKLAGDHGSMTTDPTDLVHHLRARLPRKSNANPEPSC